MPRTRRTSRNTTRDSPYALCKPISLTRGSPYTPIDSENGDIRLIELAPGKFDDIIEMRLLPYNLSADTHSHTYEALSYVWGIETAPREAVLNSLPITIPPTSIARSAICDLL
jgi:hypothetical protein